ncbi:hypothetical protein SLS58_005490 [Diplodia intermedia]|uniref:Uncharacterized protein n=1 Tax=Diplodia intermedia TaxID=856260 RepID=A0ABR3TQX6_9PEZI
MDEIIGTALTAPGPGAAFLFRKRQIVGVARSGAHPDAASIMLNREAAHPTSERTSRTGFMAQKEIESFTSDHYDLHSRKNLGGKLFGDLFAAAVTATLVAPSVTLIDRQVDAQPGIGINLLIPPTRVVVEKASSNKPLLRGLRCHSLAALERPGKLFLARPFTSVWTLYAATYAAANSAETVMRDLGLAAAGTATFAATLAVNIPLGSVSSQSEN